MLVIPMCGYAFCKLHVHFHYIVSFKALAEGNVVMVYINKNKFSVPNPPNYPLSQNLQDTSQVEIKV